MLKNYYVLIACLAITMVEAQADIWIGRPTIGDYIRRDLTEVLKAQQEAVRSKAEFNARIAEARKAFFATASDTKAHAEAEKIFADFLFAKDLTYASLFITEGISEESRNASAGWDFFTGGAIDNGIPEDGQAAFEDWVNGIRTSLGAKNSKQLLFLTPADVDKFRKALEANEPLYNKYKVLRDRQEINGGISQKEMLRRSEAARVAKSVEAARAADGGARLHKDEVKPLDVGDWLVDLETPELRQMLFKAMEAGQQTLSCTYGPSMTSRGEEGYGTYTFWFKSPPSNINALMQADQKGALQFLGITGIDACPLSDKVALTVRQAAMAGHPLSKLTKEQKQERDQIEKQASKKEKCKSFEESLALELKSKDPDKIKRQAWTKQFYANLAKKEGCIETVSSVGNSSTRQNPKARAFCKSYPKRIADARAGVGIIAGGGRRERMIQSLEDNYVKYQCDAGGQ